MPYLIHLACRSLVLSGPPGAPKVVSASKTCINLTWTPPEDDRGVPIIGYQVEKRKKDTNQWIALNALSEPIEGLSKTQMHILCFDSKGYLLCFHHFFSCSLFQM